MKQRTIPEYPYEYVYENQANKVRVYGWRQDMFETIAYTGLYPYLL